MITQESSLKLLKRLWKLEVSSGAPMERSVLEKARHNGASYLAEIKAPFIKELSAKLTEDLKNAIISIKILRHGINAVPPPL